MVQNKPWQIAVISTAVAVIVGVTVYMLATAGPSVPTRLLLIDVSTGQLYRVNLARRRVGLPARDPERGEYRLYPVQKHAGKWSLTAQALGMIRGAEVNTDAVDEETGEVLHSSNDIREYVPHRAG